MRVPSSDLTSSDMTVQNFDHFVDDDDFAPVELHDFDRSDMPGEPAGYRKLAKLDKISKIN